MFINIISPGSLASALVPGDLINTVKQTDKKMCSVANVIVNAAIGAIKALREGDLRQFDANPGDSACQLQAWKIRELSFSQELGDEADALINTAGRIKKLIQEHKNLVYVRNLKRITERSDVFFQKNLESPQITEDMAYLLQCFVLKSLKQYRPPNEEGIKFSFTTTSFETKLDRNVNGLIKNEDRTPWVRALQASLSELSVRFLRQTTPDVQVVRITNDSKYPPRAFACQFTQYKALLPYLLEKQAIVAIKEILRNSYIFYKGTPETGDFQRIETPNQRTDTLVVFEGRIKVDDFAQKISEIGFTKLILACAAIEPPLGPGSDVSDREMQTYRDFAEENVNPLFRLYHVYCNTVGGEGIVQ